MQLLINALVAGVLAGAAFWFTRLAIRMRMSRARDFVRLVVAAFAVWLVAAVVLPVGAAWTRVQVNGVQVCKDDTTGVTFKPPYTDKASVTKACNTLTSFFPWLFTADAAPLSIAVRPNGDGTSNTGYPCLQADLSDCKPPSTVTWNTVTLAAAMAVVASQQTGTATDIDLSTYCQGANCGSATYALHTAVAHWSIGGTGTKHLLNAGSNAGSSVTDGTLVLDVCYPDSATCNSSSPFDWAYATPASDATPPTAPQNLACTQGSGQYACSWSTSVDPADGVQTSGVASYLLQQNGSTVATVAATNAGLSNDFTRYSIGAGCGGSPSATQGSGSSGGQWTLVGCNGFGFEGNSNDSFSGIYAPVSGATACVSAKLSSLTTPKSYDKAAFDMRNDPTSDTSAHLAVYFMYQASNTSWYAQYVRRASDGGTQTASSAVALTGAPPFYGELCDINNAFTFTYSSDGGAPSTAFSNVALTLNNTKYAGLADSATDDGVTGASSTAVFDNVAVRNEYQKSTTVTSMTSGNCTILAKDAASSPNTSSALGSVPCGPQASMAAGHKWAPGMWVRAHTAKLNCGTSCNSTRRGIYASTLTDSNVVGVSIWASWKTLESDAGNDFSAGFLWLHNEISFITANYPGKKVALLLDFSPYGWSLSGASGVYPQYLVDAGCIYDENSAASGGGSTSLNWYKNNSTCRDYYKRLIAAYGAEFDTDPDLIYVRIQQETDDASNNVGISGTSQDAGWRDIVLATVTAFPTTNIWVPVNWVGVETAASKQALMEYYISIGAGIGDGDTIPEANDVSAYPFGYTCPSTALYCVLRGLNSSIGGSSHDYCGEFVSFHSVELSEMGYASVGGHPGLTSAQVASVWNNHSCSQYGEWEPNFNEVQDIGDGGASQYWGGAIGQKYVIDNTPLTYSSKPSGYQ